MSGSKKSLSSDEKLLENVFRIEIVFKKYRWAVLGILGAVLVCFGWFAIADYQKEQRAQRIAKVFAEIQASGLSEELLAKVKKEGGEVYDFLALNWAIKENKVDELERLRDSSNSFIARYAGYELGSMKQDFQKGKKYGEFENLILLQEGYQLILDGKHGEALKRLDAVEITSPLKEWALRIGHYGI